MNTPSPKTLGDIPCWETHYGTVGDDTPIVLAIHWMGGNAASLGFVFRDFPKPLRVVALQGRNPFESGFSWYVDGLAFYDRSEDEQAPDIRREAERVAGFLRQYKALYPAARTAVTGMSQGGDLSLALSVLYPDLIDLALPVAGRLPLALRPQQPDFAAPLPRIKVMQGAVDPIVSVASAREATAWLQAAGFDAELREYPGAGHVIEPMAPDIRGYLKNFER
jgi:predicted esterase